MDTVSSLDAIQELQPLMKHDSHIVSAGFLGTEGRIDIQKLRAQEITLHCPSGWERRGMNATMDGITDGWLQMPPLITHPFPAERAAEAWELILDKGIQASSRQ